MYQPLLICVLGKSLHHVLVEMSCCLLKAYQGFVCPATCCCVYLLWLTVTAAVVEYLDEPRRACYSLPARLAHSAVACIRFEGVIACCAAKISAGDVRMSQLVDSLPIISHARCVACCACAVASIAEYYARCKVCLRTLSVPRWLDLLHLLHLPVAPLCFCTVWYGSLGMSP